MKIASASVQLDSSHEKQQHHSIQATLRLRSEQPANTTNNNMSNSRAASVQISDAGKAAQSSEANAINDINAAVENDPMLMLIRTVVAMLIGHEIDVFDRSDLSHSTTQSQDAPPTNQTARTSAGFGLSFDRHEVYSESEQTRFTASGTVLTADGKKIDFSLSLDMSRNYREESNVSIRTGDERQKKDPLVINFAGNAAQLSNQRFRFDLDADGQTETINFVAGGSGFLAFDINGDGTINNGKELFGATSGDGFAELSRLDDDQNGWIDENDSAYRQLLVWTKNYAEHDQLATLEQAGIGAINLSRIATPFDLKGTGNITDGQIRTTGVYLHESGKAGTIQQVDLMV